MVELFFPGEFLIECWIGLILGFDVVLLNLVNLFNNSGELPFVNVGFSAVESDFFLDLKEFGLKLVFFVFLFFEFGLKFLGQNFDGLVLLLKHDWLAVYVFHEDLFVVKKFKFFELILELDQLWGFLMEFILSFFTWFLLLDLF